MDVLLWVLYAVRYRSLRRADRSCRGVLPTVVRRCVWSRNLKNDEAMTRIGSQRHKKNQCWKIVFFIVLHINWNFGHFYPPYLYNQYILISIKYLYMFCAFSDLCCRSCTNIRLRVCKLKNFILLNIHFAKHVMKRYAIKKILWTQFLIPTWYVTKCNPKLWLCYKWERNTWPFYVSFVQSFPITEKLRLNCS